MFKQMVQNNFIQKFLNAIKNWLASDPYTQSAAASYYAIFSLPGLVILIVGFAGLFLNETQVEAEIIKHITQAFGEDAATNVASIVARTKNIGNDPLMIVLGISTLLFAATGVFVQLQRSLNKIWGVSARTTKSYLKFIKMRLISLSMIIVIGFLLMISLTVTTVLTLIATWLSAYLPEIIMDSMIVVNTVLSWCLTTLLFALMYYVMPDSRSPFKHCLYGGFLAAILFEVGESGLSFYFSQAKPDSAFGATGFLILMMIWVFYSCMILLLGAHYAKVQSAEKTTT